MLLLLLMMYQAFASDPKLLQLLKALLTQHASLAETPASSLSGEHVTALQQAVQEAGVASPDSLALGDAGKVRWLTLGCLLD